MIQQKTQLCHVKHLGCIDYDEAYAIQQDCVRDVIMAVGNKAFLLLCEHPSIITFGRMSKPEHLLFSKEYIKQKGVMIKDVDRGGDITLHSPGQLVVYPIFNLAYFRKDLKWYLSALEDAVIDFLSGYAVFSGRITGRTGVWAGHKKVASIGIGVRKWVAYHGVGINIHTDLDLFSLIKPCGLDVQMTSLEKLTPKKLDIPAVNGRILRSFQKVFNLEYI